jgi:hypothetical protein
MIICTNQTKLFELLQSEKFFVGNSLFAKAKQQIENLSNRFLKEKKIFKKLLANLSCYKTNGNTTALTVVA